MAVDFRFFADKRQVGLMRDALPENTSAVMDLF
jgi:hypothetical protein